jgi:Mce-associated membrane protein
VTGSMTAAPGARRKPRDRRGGLFAGWGLVGWAAIVAAAVFLGWSAWAVWQDDPAARTGPERVRDVVLRSAREQIAALNTMNPAQVDAGLRAWSSASTGALRDQLQRDEPQNRVKIGRSRTTAAATVTGAAVTSLDIAAGKAKVIASVQVKLALQGGSPTLQRKRFEAGTVRTPSGWKLESITAIPVGAR